MSKEAEPEPTASKFSLEALNSGVQTLAIVLAGAWGVYTFVYEAKIAPGLAPPSVSVTSALERVGQRDGVVASDPRSPGPTSARPRSGSWASPTTSWA